jgi:hypothetical protein
MENPTIGEIAGQRNLRLRPWGLIFLILASSGTRDAFAADGEVTMLEPVFVEASTGDPWNYFTVPGFEVISHCSDSFNETYARALEKATAARLAVLPAEFWGDMPTPMKIILYNREPKRREGFNSGSPIDLNWVSGDGAAVGSGYVEHTYPVTVGDGDTYIDCGNYWSVQTYSDDFCVDPDSDIRLQNRVPKLPAWFEAGMEGRFGLYPNRIIQSSAFSDTVILPSAFWVSSAETIAIQNEAAKKPRKGQPLPFHEFLPLGELLHGGPPGNKRNLWDSEASLLVRWGLYRSGNRQGFLDFVRHAAREPATEALFQGYLGVSYGEAQKRLLEYLPTAVSDPIRVPISAPPHRELNIREARSVDVARIIGDWGRLEGRSVGMGNIDYQRECLDQADRLFERIRVRKNSDPLFLAAFGLYQDQIGDSVQAREALEAATGAGVIRPRAYVALAQIRLDDALPSVQQGIGDLDRVEFNAIVALLTTARVQMPSMLATYDVLARVLEHAPERPTPEDLRPLEAALELFPQNSALAYKVANLCKFVGYPEKAASIIERAKQFSDSGEGRTLLSGFPETRTQ